MYKTLDSSDVVLRKFKVFKNWYYQLTNTGSELFIVQDGTYDTSSFQIGDPQNYDGTYKKLVWDSINHIYYQSGSYHEISSDYSYINPSEIYSVSRSLDNGIRVLNIPEDIFGEQIKPASIKITTSSLNIFDDGHYNLYVSGTNIIIGNVFYDTGQLIITSQSYTSSLDKFDLSFKSTLEIKELEVSCNILESEFNYSYNPSSYQSVYTSSNGTGSYYNDTSSISYIGPLVSGSLKPIITTIGLYNEKNELLVVAKLGRPYNRNYESDTTFVIRLDI